MTDEKDPGQESVKTGSSDDEPIIDLTDEVIVETKDHSDKLESPETQTDDPQQTAEDHEASKVKEDDAILALDDSGLSDSQEDEAVVDLDDQVAEGRDDSSQGQLIAPAAGAIPDADKSEIGDVTAQFDLRAFDEDNTIIDDNFPDMGEVTEQFDLNDLDKDTTAGDGNFPDIGEVTEQFDLNDLDKDDIAGDDNLPDFGEVTAQFDLNALDKDDTAGDDNPPDFGEVTAQFDLNDLDKDDTAGDDNPPDFGEVTEQFDLKDFDEDNTIIVDNSQDIGEVTQQFDLNAFDEADENIGAMNGDETAATQDHEDVFDLEEEIELEYELDDDEDELIELKDERTEDNQDFVDLMLGASKKSDQSDDDDNEQTQYFKFDTEEQGDIIVLDADRDQLSEINAPSEKETADFMDNDDLPDLEAISGFDFEDEEDGPATDDPEAPGSDVLLAEEETPEFGDSDDLPDLEALGSFDFGDDEDDDLAIEEPETDGSDDIIAKAVDRSLDEGEDREPVGLADEAEFTLGNDDAIMDLDDPAETDEAILALADEAPLTPEDDEDLLDLNGAAELETDDEIIPLDDFDDLDGENSEDIVEITEFEQHFPADGEALLKKSGILDASGADEDDFLELIDVEEDSLSDDEAFVEFSDLAEKAEAAGISKINQFFSDDSEQDQSKTLTPRFKFNDNLDNILLKDEAADSKDEDFDFDHRSIAQQVDRLDTFLPEDASDEPAVASFPTDQVAEKEASGLDNSTTEQGFDGLPAIPAGQINAAIERVIKEKFSAKIEGIIYEVIEKAVAKEIDRLKETLIGTHTMDDYDD